MNDCFATSKSLTQRRHLCDVRAGTARNWHEVMTFLCQKLRQMAAYKSGTSRDCNFHEVLFRRGFRRRSICVGQTVLRKSPTAPARRSGCNWYRMRLPSRRSTINSAFFRIERCREIEGPEIVKKSAISPAESSPSLSCCRIWRRVGSARARKTAEARSEEHTSELQSPYDLVCRLLLEKK